MNSQPHRATQEQILQFMTTEHFTLQTARAATVAEANGRSTLYLGSVSSAVVALAFIGQVSGMSGPFFLFGIVLFPSLFFLGVVTFARVHQTGLEDMIHALEISRIRHYYVEVAPEAAPYFLHSTHDDVAGFFHDMGAAPSWFQYFLTTSGSVAVINSVIAGVFAGMLARFALEMPAYFGAGLGIAVFLRERNRARPLSIDQIHEGSQPSATSLSSKRASRRSGICSSLAIRTVRRQPCDRMPGPGTERVER